MYLDGLLHKNDMNYRSILFPRKGFLFGRQIALYQVHARKISFEKNVRYEHYEHGG